MIPLSTALANWGKKVDLLGCDRGWCNNKHFLSYDTGRGWSVKELGVFQRILRSCFGAYKSTHFKYVTLALAQHPDQVPKYLISHIRILWNKTYRMQVPCPLDQPLPTTPNQPIVMQAPVNGAPKRKRTEGNIGTEKPLERLAQKNIESSTLATGLVQFQDSYNYRSISGDGYHCLFRAIAAGLLRDIQVAKPADISFITLCDHLDKILAKISASNDLKNAYNDFLHIVSEMIQQNIRFSEVIRDDEYDFQLIQFLRLLASEYNEAHKDQHAFINDQAANDNKTPQQYFSDIKDMGKKELGGHLEISALTHCLNVKVHILDIHGVGEGSNLNLPHYMHGSVAQPIFTIHLIYFSKHYNLAIPK